MKIAGKNAADINRVLESALQYGARYVCLDTGLNESHFRAETMHFFKERSEALQYSYIKGVTDKEYLETLPVLALQQQLHRKMDLQQITGAHGKEFSDIHIDTGHIHYLERARREIFAEELVRQLKDRGIKINQQQLREHLTNDDQQFSIGGTRLEHVTEKPYIIRIEQNDSRAFLITAIEPQNIHQQKNKVNMRSEVLEGTVKKTDALEIKNMLLQEIEKGNRFVSFPMGKDGLKKEDFTPFKTAIAALEHAGNKTTIEVQHNALSIRIVGMEMEKILENKKEQAQERGPDKERESRRSRDQER